MTSPTTTQLRKTALNAVHRRLNAKMVNFGGWDMPADFYLSVLLSIFSVLVSMDRSRLLT